tara:strand:- start:10471 stop:11067 length:597 start_codon:yes stop_codon:yes gene_type:complete
MDNLQKMLAEMFPQSEQAAILKRQEMFGMSDYDTISGDVKRKLMDESNFSLDELIKASAFAREYDDKYFPPLFEDISDRARIRAIRPESFITGILRARGGKEPSPSLDESPKSKSIDDILRQSDISEFLSKVVSDKTNVDVNEDTQVIPSNIGRMDRQTLQEILNMQEPVPQDTSGVGRMNINTLMEILRMQEPTPNR